MEREYTAFVHLSSQTGELMAQLDRPPAGYPTGDWRPGEVVIDRYALGLPAGFVPGEYVLETGFYYLPNMEPLGEPVTLGAVWIE
jgi:hypothetical protein